MAASSIEDYENDIIKKHEKTLQRKEQDRTRLTDTQSANIGPVFLTFRKGDSIKEKMANISKSQEPYRTVKADDGVTHTVTIPTI